MKDLILLDLDKTLIDESYQPTIPDEMVRQAVNACLERDITIGLCSDSALNLLQYWEERFGMKGPIVFEKGAAVFYPTAGEKYVATPEATKWFPELRRRFAFKMVDRLPEWFTVVGDNTMFIQEQQRLPGGSRYAVLLSGVRQYSFGAHVRAVRDDGTLLIDTGALPIIRDEVVDIATSLFGEELDIDANPEYGTLIIHAACTRKRNGVRAIIEQRHPSRILMVGDSLPDFLDLAEVDQYAVGNAKEEYKQRCKYVANATYTEGVIEILGRLCVSLS